MEVGGGGGCISLGSRPIPRNRRLLRISSLGVCFRARSNIIHTISNISCALSHNRALNIINRSNSNGSIATVAVVNLVSVPPKGVRNNSIHCHNHSVLRVARRRVRRVHNGSVTVVFRSPVASLGPICGVNGRMNRNLHLRHNCSGRRTLGHTARLLSLINVPRPRGHIGRCPRRFSNNVHRHIVVTVTLTYSPSVLVTSRPAATLSIAVRTRVVRLVRRVRRGGNGTVVVVARSLNIITSVTSGVVIVCTNHPIRFNATRRVFCRDHRPCA